MDLWQEPVRGAVPDRSFYGLPGIEQVRAWVRAVAPIPPIHHLTGVFPTTVGPGTAACSMPAAPWLTYGAGIVEPHVLVDAALGTAAQSTAPPGAVAELLWMSTTQIRSISPSDGSLVGRGRVLHGGRTVSLVEATVENALGRPVWHATGQIRFVALDPPPEAPAVLEPASHPRYPTPDPYARPLDADAASSLVWGGRDGLTVLRGLVGGELPPTPIARLTGIHLTSVEPGRLEARMVAHGWFRIGGPQVASGALAMAAHLVAAGAAGSVQEQGRGMQTLQLGFRQLRPVPADDRPLAVRAAVDHQDDQRIHVSGNVADSDGPVALITYVGWDAPLPTAAAHLQSERVLATVLFTDIVGSTDRARQLGDARWREVLDAHHAATRRAIGRLRGREVKSTGDGTLATFDSPTRAVECALAICDDVRPLGIEVRAGVHTGECEVAAGDVSGIAVHLAARIEAAASPGEVLVSETVRTLTAGSGLVFEDRGLQSLKGIDGAVRLFAAKRSS